MERWIQIDEAEDVVGSLRHVIRTAQFVGEDQLAWKWVVLALHSALQGACVCHLTSTAAPVGAVTERNAAEWLAYFEDSRSNPNARAPKTYLMGLPDLLAAVRKPYSAGDRSNAAGVELSDSELSWLRRFHEVFRNQFVHFEPIGWSIEVSGIPEIAKLVVRIIEDIMQIGWACRNQNVEQREEMKCILQTLTALEWPA